MLNEPAQVDLMNLLASTGDRAGALAQYRTLVRVSTASSEWSRCPIPAPTPRRSGRGWHPGDQGGTSRGAGCGCCHPVPLVERDAELAHLQQLWRGAGERGRGGRDR